MRADDLLRFVIPGDPRLSPDGSRVLFGRKEIVENRYLTRLCIVPVEGGEVRVLTGGDKSASMGRWRPDGGAIAFLAARKDDLTQIHVLPTDGGEATAVTSLPEGSIGAYAWSPDGTRLALTFRETVAEHTKAAGKEREAAKGSTPPWVMEEAWHRLDGDGYFGEARYRLHLVDLATGEITLLSERDALGEYDFDWLPDSSGLVVVRNRGAEPLREAPDKGLFLVRLDGSEEELAVTTKGEKGSPRVSPGGDWIAWAGDVDETDPWGTRNTRIYCAPLAGGEVRDLSGDSDLDAAVATLSDAGDPAFGAALEWAADGSGVYAQVGIRGTSQLAFAPLDGVLAPLTEGRHNLTVGNVAGGRIAALRGDATHLPEVGVLEPELATGRTVFRALTDLNRALYDEVRIEAPEEIHVPSTDGETVHAWTMGSGEAGTVVMVHGGPHAQYGWALFHEFQTLAGAGWRVVYGNPRGSKGYGEAWCAAIKGDWGNKDWDDVSVLVGRARELAGGARVAIGGGSYGGYITNWAIAHDRESFHCAISDRCVSNMVSMAMNSDFPFNKDGYFKGTAWGDLEAIRELWRQSPISHFEGVTTPTLVIHSEGDLRCNVEQGEEIFLSLRQQGTPARMVRYPSATSHGLSRSGPPDLRLHRLGEMLTWLNRWPA